MKVLAKFSKRDLWSIPNILCYIRFLLIPLFVVQYIKAEEPSEYIRAAYCSRLRSYRFLRWIYSKDI